MGSWASLGSADAGRIESNELASFSICPADSRVDSAVEECDLEVFLSCNSTSCSLRSSVEIYSLRLTRGRF